MIVKHWRVAWVRQAALAALAAAALSLGACATYGQATDTDSDRDAASGTEAEDSSDGGPDEEPTPIGEVEIGWRDRTLGFDAITDDQSQIDADPAPSGSKLFRIVFKYLDDPDEHETTASARSSLFEYFASDPITVIGPDAKVYERRDGAEFISMMIGGSGETDIVQFSVTFEVPADSRPDDFELDTGSGGRVPLTTYASEEYLADQAESD
ncbi:MAG: hypothetical protein LBC97_13835 [Bifidobacteriaceae bacterium]|jgi:hypothetical protein|nr:hypothetical protein [Bifidobacteriaceae bacterium]